ncbi:hypothetical protein MMPV_003706 [Pyropia vietnamensis]
MAPGSPQRRRSLWSARRRRSDPAAILRSAAFLFTVTTAACIYYAAPWSTLTTTVVPASPDGHTAAIWTWATAWARRPAAEADNRYGRSLRANGDDNPPLTSLGTGDVSRPGTTALATVSRAGGTSYGTLCEPADTFLKRPVALVLYIPGALFTFLGLAIVTDEYFVPALERICDALQLSDDVAGATFAAAGSSAPELFTSLLAVFVTEDEVGVGTIVGSAVFNVLVIIGVSALLAGSTLQLDWRPLVRDSAFYTVFIVVLLVQVMGVTKGDAEWWEGLIMLGLYACYILFMAFANKPYMRVMERFLPEAKRQELAAERQLMRSADGDRDDGAEPTTNGNDTPVRAIDKDMEAGACASPPSSPTTPTASQPGVSFSGEATTPNAAAPNALTRRSTYGSTPRALSKASGELRHHFSARSVRADERAAAAAAATAAVGPAGAGGLEKPAADGADGRAAGGDNGEAASDGDSDKDAAPAGTFLGVAKPTTTPGKLLFPFAFVWMLAFRYTIIDCSRDKYARYWAITFLVSVVWIAGISYLMVESARYFGCIVGIPAAVLGVTVLAAGTSVPDALASVSVARAGKGDFAVSNALGSNCFDVGIGLGAPWFLGGLILGRPQVIPTEPLTAIVVPVIILFAVIAALLGLFALRRWQLSPLVGWLLLGAYVAFVAYSLIDVYVLQD